MTVLPCTREANLLGCLKSRTTPDQAEYYWRLVERREVSASLSGCMNSCLLGHPSFVSSILAQNQQLVYIELAFNQMHQIDTWGRGEGAS